MDKQNSTVSAAGSNAAWVTIGLVAVHLVLLALAAAAMPRPRPDNVGPAVVIGLVYVEGALIAAWAALGAGRLSLRIPLGFLATAAVAQFLTMYVVRTGGNVGIGLVATGLLLVQYVLVLAAVFVMRAAGAFAGANRPVGQQFGIWQLLLWTTFIAILAGVGRGLSHLDVNLPREALTFGVFFGLFAAFNTALAPLPIWAFLGARNKLLWIGISVAFGLALLGVKMFTFAELSTHPQPGPVFFIGEVSTQLVTLFGTLAVVTWVGGGNTAQTDTPREDAPDDPPQAAPTSDLLPAKDA